MPDIVLAGGFTMEDHVFKGLALGAPYVKAIGMARAPVTACTASAALWYRIAQETDETLVSRHGRTKEEVFYGSIKLAPHLGKEKFEALPAGGLGVYTYLMRISQGLRQLMAGARKFKLSDSAARPDRDDLAALTPEAAKVSGLPYISEHDKELAEKILSEAT